MCVLSGKYNSFRISIVFEFELTNCLASDVLVSGQLSLAEDEHGPQRGCVGLGKVEAVLTLHRRVQAQATIVVFVQQTYGVIHFRYITHRDMYCVSFTNAHDKL